MAAKSRRGAFLRSTDVHLAWADGGRQAGACSTGPSDQRQRCSEAGKWHSHDGDTQGHWLHRLLTKGALPSRSFQGLLNAVTPSALHHSLQFFLQAIKKPAGF